MRVYLVENTLGAAALMAAGLLAGCGSEATPSPSGGEDAGASMARTDAGPIARADGGGGSDAGSADDASPGGGGADASGGGLCPPSGPFGNEVGSVAPEVTLMDCDGNPVSTHSLCAAPVSWTFNYTEWCPPCNAFANGTANTVFERYQDQGVEAIFIITEDSGGGPPSLEKCRQIRDRFGLQMTVVIDPEDTYQRALNARANSFSVVQQEGSEIVFKAQYQEQRLGDIVAEALGGR